MPVYFGNKKAKLYIGTAKIKKGYIGATRVYSAGNIVTYVVDTSNTKQEEVDEGGSVLSPKTFTPSKSGWTFIGWRSDKTASGSVISSMVMGDSPITLYAVFRQTVTLSYAGNGATSGSTTAQTGYRYYNNGNVANPSFTVKENRFVKSGYIWIGWMSGSTAYAVGQSVTLSSNMTLTAQWYTATATTFAYTGGIQRWTAPITGLYLLKCYGAGGGCGTAQSGDDSPYCSYGGAGGTSYYYVKLNAGQVLYIVVGQGGRRAPYDSGGEPAAATYNGGGESGTSKGGSGGGATHIAVVSGILSSVAKNNLLCVAAGGGGGGDQKRVAIGGTGGGATGGRGGDNGVYDSGAGGTQSGNSSAGIWWTNGVGSYGKGGTGNYYAGGGGGGLYGGNGGSQSAGGGGGSGYIPYDKTTHNGRTYGNVTYNGGGGIGGYTNDLWWYVEAYRETFGGNGSASIQFIAV